MSLLSCYVYLKKQAEKLGISSIIMHIVQAECTCNVYAFSELERALKSRQACRLFSPLFLSFASKV